MNRPFPRFEVLGLTAALAFVGACTPNTSVKPGAPVIIELSVVENGGATITTVTPTTLSCPGATPEGGACDSVKYAVCESATTNDLCRCVPNPPPTTPTPMTDAGASDAATADAAAATSDAGKPDAGAASSDAGSDAAATLDGTWSCTFAPTSTVLYVFDRVLDTEFLGDGGGAFGLATISSTPTPPNTVMLNGDYASNGTFNIIFTDPKQLNDYRADGPSILFTAVPALPAGATVSVTLDNTKVLAKDGRTPFTGMNLLMDGIITFVTQPFTASPITPPAPIPPISDAGTDAAPLNAPDMTPATITFTNTVDPVALAAHITAKAVPFPAGGSPTTVVVDVTSMDDLTVSITPTGKTTWPAASTITIAIDAMATDAVGDVLAAPVDPVSFTTEAM